MFLASFAGVADACSCVALATGSPDPIPIIPRQGSTNVAVNPTIWWIGAEVGTLATPTVLVDGVLWSADESWESERGGRWEGYALRLHDDLPPNSDIEVKWLGGRVVLAFATGSHRDDEPPTWDGEYEASAEKGEMGNCGDFAVVSVVFAGVEDDHSDLETLISVAGPRDVGVLNVGDGMGFETSWLEVCGGDISLNKDLHRSYDVVLFDKAGNRTEVYEVSTRGSREGCACDSGGSPSMWLAGLGLLGLFRRRGALGS